MDGNVIRVISRLKAISANPKEPTTVKSFWWVLNLLGILVYSLISHNRWPIILCFFPSWQAVVELGFIFKWYRVQTLICLSHCGCTMHTVSIPTRWLGIWVCSGRVALVSINVGSHPLKDMEDVSHLLCSFFSTLFPLASCPCSNFLVGNWQGNLLTLPGPEISTRLSWNLGQLSALH